MMEIGDNEYMLKVSRNDTDSRTAFDYLFHKYRKPLYNFLLRKLNDKSAAEDIFQETFLRLYRTRENYQPSAKFSVYLYTIAYRLCINYGKKKSRWGFIKILSEKLFPCKEESAEIEETVEDNKPLPDAMLIEGEIREKLIQALQEISDIHRTVFVLYELQNFSYNEIGEITQTNPGTVKSRLNHARKKLREILSPYIREKKQSEKRDDGEKSLNKEIGCKKLDCVVIGVDSLTSECVKTLTVGPQPATSCVRN